VNVPVGCIVFVHVAVLVAVRVIVRVDVKLTVIVRVMVNVLIFVLVDVGDGKVIGQFSRKASIAIVGRPFVFHAPFVYPCQL
jgi:hypothetical protein